MGKLGIGWLCAFVETAALKVWFVSRALHELTVALCRGNGILLRKTIEVLARGIGDTFGKALLFQLRISSGFESLWPQCRQDCRQTLSGRVGFRWIRLFSLTEMARQLDSTVLMSDTLDHEVN